MSLTPPSSHGGGSAIGPVEVSGTPTAGQIIVATSPTAATWQDEAGGNGSVQGTLDVSNVFVGSQILAQASPLASNSQSGLSIQSPPVLLAAMSAVCIVSVSAPADVPDISDNIDVAGTLYVTNAAGTSTLIVNGFSSQATPVVGLGTSIDWTGSTPTIVGVDLTWDDATATVTSAAGGIYFATLILACGPD